MRNNDGQGRDLNRGRLADSLSVYSSVLLTERSSLMHLGSLRTVYSITLKVLLVPCFSYMLVIYQCPDSLHHNHVNKSQ